MSNIRGIHDKDNNNKDDKNNKNDNKSKYEMFSQSGSQSGTGVLRPVKQEMDDLRNLQKQQQQRQMSSNQNLDRAIFIFKNGFKIGEDGEFQSNDDPKNKGFMESIKKGYIPPQLEQILKEKFGPDVKELGVNIVDRTREEYKPPPPPKFTAFQGQGNTLGNNTNVNTSLSECEAKEITVDDKQETIRVQLILNNGKRVTQKLNSTSTVIELYAHAKFLTNYNGNFQLLAGFPPKPLDNPKQNVKEAGLNGARVTMKNV